MSDRVLERIRTTVGGAVGRGSLPAAEAAHPGPRPAAAFWSRAEPELAPGPTGGSDRDDRALLESFAAALELVGGTVRVASTREAAVDAVRELLPVPGGEVYGRFIAWDDEAVAPVVDAMVADGWTRVEQRVPVSGADRSARLHDVASCEVGVTSAVAALAATGSIVVSSGEGRGRLASLLPPVHIAIVPLSRLRASLADWMQSLAPGAPPSSLVIITGPSRTADIEQTLSRGVHGPKAVHVIVVPG